jgi:hypothetical protein
VREGWYDQVWSGGKITPAPHRKDESLGATEDSTGFDPDWIPMLPEELIPAPDRFQIEFTEGLVVEIVADSTGSSFWHQLADRSRALVSRSPRLRLTLTPVDAGRLYRSLPEEPAFALRSNLRTASPAR